jgi:hypothetical protein
VRIYQEGRHVIGHRAADGHQGDESMKYDLQWDGAHSVSFLAGEGR